MADKVDWRATINLDLLGPTRKSDGTVITTGTCTGRLFDHRRSNRVAVAAASGAATLFLKKDPKFEAGDTVRLSQQDGTFHESVVTSVDHAARSLVLTTITTDEVLVDARIDRKLGADVDMPIFNAAGAAANTKDWGRRGVAVPAHQGITADMTVHVEAILVDGSTTIVKSRLIEFTDGV
jgi:hypothetical protein